MSFLLPEKTNVLGFVFVVVVGNLLDKIPKGLKYFVNRLYNIDKINDFLWVYIIREIYVYSIFTDLILGVTF